jgi:hypothetical protein
VKFTPTPRFRRILPPATLLWLVVATLFLVDALLIKSTDGRRVVFFLLAGWGYLLALTLLGMWMLAGRAENLSRKEDKRAPED